jgi:hypothetical protein
MQTHPIGVKCPRCAEDIECTVEVKRVPGKGGSAVTDMRLVDLAERFAEHYLMAGHTPAPRAGVDFVEPWQIELDRQTA